VSQLPNAALAHVEDVKVRDYLLNPGNLPNQGKAGQFGQYGLAWFKKCHSQVTPEIDRELMVKGFLVLGVTLI